MMMMARSSELLNTVAEMLCSRARPTGSWQLPQLRGSSASARGEAAAQTDNTAASASAGRSLLNVVCVFISRASFVLSVFVCSVFASVQMCDVAPNDNKMSDGGRDGAPLGVEVCKS